MATFFSEFFSLDIRTIDDYGAFNVSLVNDLPLFVDPFLLFNSTKPEYEVLHHGMIQYLKFLRDKSSQGSIGPGLLASWYYFKEVKQNWLGFSKSGNSGSGLGPTFASALNENLGAIFSESGETITKGTHIEKCSLVANGVGRDHVSDFTVNLIKEFLCKYTQDFAKHHIVESRRKRVAVEKARFNYVTESWESLMFDLPWANGDYVILSPRDILTKDDNWINRSDLISNLEQIARSIPDQQLRETLDNFLRTKLARRGGKAPTQEERRDAAEEAIGRFPKIIDFYIKGKEETGDDATKISDERVKFVEVQFGKQISILQSLLASATAFYTSYPNTHAEAMARVCWLKDVIENKGGHRIFYVDGRPIEREADLHVLFRLVWFGSPSDAGAEANDGRGPVDFKISRGSKYKTLVEMKLASNTQLERNLQRQAEVYQAASDAAAAIKVVIYFSYGQLSRVNKILKRTNLDKDPNVVLIDARNDNKPSGSKA